jgi:hypothetical protein
MFASIRLLLRLGLAVLAGFCARHAFGADDIAVCPIRPIDGGVLTCGRLVFKYHSESQCLPLRTPDLDGVEDSQRHCAYVQRACLTIEGDAEPGAKGFNAVCTKNLAGAASKAEAAGISKLDDLDTDHEQELKTVIVRPDLVTVRSLQGSCVLQAAGCLRDEENFHWLRRIGRPLVAGDVFDTSRKDWPSELKALFEAEIQAGQGKQHTRPFPDGSCYVENSDLPARWRFEKEGLSIRIMGMFDCGSNVGGGIVTLSWDQIKPLMRPDPLVNKTGPEVEGCKKGFDCMD